VLVSRIKSGARPKEGGAEKGQRIQHSVSESNHPDEGRDPCQPPKSMFYVYLLASKPYGTLYIGMTSDLERRVWEHKNGLVAGFTKRYQVERLVWLRLTILRRPRHFAAKNSSRNGNATGKSICSNGTTHTGSTSTQAFDFRRHSQNEKIKMQEFYMILDHCPCTLGSGAKPSSHSHRPPPVWTIKARPSVVTPAWTRE
jgi:hypothetical protein